ncbi:hypothetical protein [Blastopirellula marina]|uniref:Uncharacterized protein n=1 Tax=Blastopirellula marina DSM 3645 TaxID=314230 RepID=A4A039_9BACT|nr:hypothetical protein [Blastopirellula marina]EAQ77825.1 hypothetical protein DSM3645_05974 [Blastopirellula marina DSM 3645]
MSYGQMILLTAADPWDLERLEAHLCADCEAEPEIGMLISSSPEGARFLELQWEDWAIAVVYESGDIVRQESAEIAQSFAEFREDQERIANCSQRIIVMASDDPEMEHFHDFALLIESLEKLPGAVLFDPENETFS